MASSALILDIAVAAVLLIFILHGASRGLLLSLCGLVAVLVAFVGASLFSDLLAPQVSAYLEPHFASAIQSGLEQQMQGAFQSGAAQAGEDIPLTDVLNVLKDMGFYQSAVDAVNEAVENGLTSVAAGTAAAVAASIAGSVARTVLFALSFGAILVLWTILSHVLDLVARLPGLHFLNKTGGALLGLLKGCLILFLCAGVVRYLGNILPEEMVEQSHLARIFFTVDPLSLLFSLGT